MELIERAVFLADLRAKAEALGNGDGHCIFIGGEMGIGKTSLVRCFLRESSQFMVYQGICENLFTHRPLEPLWDIAAQMGISVQPQACTGSDQAMLFSQVFQVLHSSTRPTLLLFEDIHWADEATLDFIKFLARRITQLRCIFLLTYRDEVLHRGHPLRNVMGQLPVDSFTRWKLPPLSRAAVEKMATEKGYSGTEAYHMSGGNPFYLSEIMKGQEVGVPENVKDVILSVFNRQCPATRQAWEILSIMPNGLELKYLEHLKEPALEVIERSLEDNILALTDGVIHFRREIYRRTIELSLSPLLKIRLNRNIIGALLENFLQDKEIDRIIHHARDANEHELVSRFAPVAAKTASALGARGEAARLLLLAIESHREDDPGRLAELCTDYARECHLTGNIDQALTYQCRALELCTNKAGLEQRADCLVFLSRLYACKGSHQKAGSCGSQAVSLLEDRPPSATMVLALCNMSRLELNANTPSASLYWAQRAMGMANSLQDAQALSHAYNAMGNLKSASEQTKAEGIALLQQSLALALPHTDPDLACNLYLDLAIAAIGMKVFSLAKEIIPRGIAHCHERGTSLLANDLLALRSRLYLETGDWDKASQLAEELTAQGDLAPGAHLQALSVLATIQMRRSQGEVAPILEQAMSAALENGNTGHALPLALALLEHEWLNGAPHLKGEAMAAITTMFLERAHPEGHQWQEFLFWAQKARKHSPPGPKAQPAYRIADQASAQLAASCWQQCECPYMRGLALSQGNERDKRTAIEVMDKLGARFVADKLKREMRAAGIKRIPRGIRKTTSSNTAYLTQREMQVLQLLQQGMQNKEIAEKLFVSPKTVDHHVSAILLKLDVSSRAKAVQEALRRHILFSEPLFIS